MAGTSFADCHCGSHSPRRLAKCLELAIASALRTVQTWAGWPGRATGRTFLGWESLLLRCPRRRLGASVRARLQGHRPAGPSPARRLRDRAQPRPVRLSADHCCLARAMGRSQDDDVACLRMVSTCESRSVGQSPYHCYPCPCRSRAPFGAVHHQSHLRAVSGAGRPLGSSGPNGTLAYVRSAPPLASVISSSA